MEDATPGQDEAPGRPGTKLAVGVTLGAIAAVSLLIDPIALLIVIGALQLVATGELFRLVRRRGVTPVPLAGFVTVAACIAVAYRGPDSLLSALPGIAAASTVLTFILLIARKRREGPLASVAVTVAGSLYVGALGSFIIAMRRAPFGFRIVLVFGLMACLNDAFAYIAGHLFGRHRLKGDVSPSKTWEGVAGGTIGTFAVAAISAWKVGTPFTIDRALVLASLVAVVMPLGDLAESTLKRDASVKDSGTAIHGHGGVLDRLDGLLFAAPVFYFAYRAMVR